MVIKVLLLGDGGIGKTTLAVKAAGRPQSHDGKITIFFDTHLIKTPILSENIMIFDFGGQRQFRALLNEKLPLLTRACAALVCFDLSRFVTYKNLEFWFNLLMKLPPLPIALVGTKQDKEPAVDQQLIQELMTQKNIDMYFETSSFLNYNILAPFQWVIQVTKKNHSSSELNSKALILQIQTPIQKQLT
ncbi:MAG: ADP-ribosylation factor-like protein [Candidatus Hodarchaeota archaeon]